MTVEVDDFLAHYGIPGMKWGKRQRQDSGGGDRAKAEAKTAKAEAKTAENMQKALKYHDRAAESKQLIKELDDLGIHSPEMRKLYGKAVDQSDRMFRFTQGTTKEKAVSEERAKLAKKQNQAEKDASAKEQGKLTRGQKVAVGAAVAGAALVVAYGVYKYPDIVTRNAKAGENISVRNFMQRYTKRSTEFSGEKITKEAFAKMDDNDVIVKAGTKFKRLTQIPDEDLSGRLYTSFKDGDNDRYQGIYGPVLRKRTKVKELYVNEMEMGVPIKSPSAKMRVQILLDMAKENKTFTDPDDGSKVTLLGHLENLSIQRMTMKDLLDGAGLPGDGKKSADDLALENYNIFARQIVVKNPISEEYFSKIKAMGYNALIDDNDAKQLADAPMILLDAANTVKNRTSTLLTDKLSKEARKRITELGG